MPRNFTVSLLLLIGIALFLTQFPAHGQSNDPWAPFQFLLGKWSGLGSGKPGESTGGSSSFSFDLDKKIIVRKNKVEFPPKPGEKSGMVHEDLMIIYRQHGESTFRAIYFDNEGQVINYMVSFPTKQSVVFESPRGEKGPRFRLVYVWGADGVLSIEFLIAPPGGEFKSYIKGTAKKTP